MTFDLPLDEASRRADDWTGGIPVVLPDGSEWWFSQPVAQVGASDRHGPAILRHPFAGVSWSFGPDVPSDINAILSAKLFALTTKYLQAETDADRACATLEISWFLLARNYLISVHEFEGLMLRANSLDASAQSVLAESLRGVVVLALGRSLLLKDAI